MNHVGNSMIDKLIPGNLYYITCSFEHYQAFEKFDKLKIGDLVKWKQDKEKKYILS
jgi:hypothetical protein